MKMSLLAIICCLFILTQDSSTTIAKPENKDQTINIGAVVHLDSRVGKEQKTAMEIAVEDVDANLDGKKLCIHYRNGSEDPLESVFTAHRLIQENQAKVIIGTGQWQETTLIADLGKPLQVPTISLLAPTMNPKFASLKWPNLIQMGRTNSDQLQCISDLVSFYQWRRVIVIYENAPLGGDSGSFSRLSKVLLEKGSHVEYELSLPPVASAVKHEVRKLVEENCYSRVFIVLHLSQTLARHLFLEAKKKGLMGKESVWILAESIVDYFPSLESSALDSLKGAIGLKIGYSESSESFKHFEARFKAKFSKEYTEERNSNPGFHALQAYDAIMTIAKAAITSEVLTEDILSTNFTGLTGQIYFKDGKVASMQKMSYRILNVVNQKLVQGDLWSPDVGFASNQANGAADRTRLGGLKGMAYKGWKMPTEETQMRIGIPVRQAFTNFVNVKDSNDCDSATGFSIELFKEAVAKSYGHLPYKFHPFNGTYDELVDCVYNKTFDAAVGDFTILANRTEFVEFTQPYAESGLALILPVKPDYKNKGWIFVRPFKADLWIATFAILIYTMLIVWFLEHESNPDFRGPLQHQLSTALWFTFSSLFFAHREGVRNGYTRVVMVVWFFVVLILTQSYTADLSSMLTMARLKQNNTDIATLVTTKAMVGCHNRSFTMTFMQDVLNFKKENILGIETDLEYFHSNFTAGNITAAFLEIPYAKLFLSLYCDQYTMTMSNYRFEGLSFVFPKGSPFCTEVSRAILNITEQGDLTMLENKWLNATNKCLADQSDSSNSNGMESLTLKSFWGLFVLSAATSTFCLLGSLIPLIIMTYRQRQRDLLGSLIPLIIMNYRQRQRDLQHHPNNRNSQ